MSTLRTVYGVSGVEPYLKTTRPWNKSASLTYSWISDSVRPKWYSNTPFTSFLQEESFLGSGSTRESLCNSQWVSHMFFSRSNSDTMSDSEPSCFWRVAGSFVENGSRDATPSRILPKLVSKADGGADIVSAWHTLRDIGFNSFPVNEMSNYPLRTPLELILEIRCCKEGGRAVCMLFITASDKHDITLRVRRCSEMRVNIWFAHMI